MKRNAFMSMAFGAGVLTVLTTGLARAGEASAPVKDEAWYVAKYDQDGDGELSAEEREAAKGKWRENREQRMLKHHDTDGDGVLSEGERAEAEAAAKAVKQERLTAYDQDGDGRLSQEERAVERQARKAKRQAAKAEAEAAKADEPAPGEATDASPAE